MQILLALFLAVVQIVAWIVLFVSLILSPYLIAVTMIDAAAQKRRGGG